MKMNSKKTYGLMALVIFVGAILLVSALPSPINLSEEGNSGASGSATLHINSRTDVHSTNLRIKVEDLHPQPGYVYEVWLVDDDSNDKLSVGALNTNQRARGNFKLSQDMVNPYIYDSIVITQEPINDINPEPGMAVLSGDILNSLGEDVPMVALLKGRSEVPRTNSRAQGEGSFTIDTNLNMVMYVIDVAGIDSETGAHIHGFAPEGSNEDVLFSLLLGSHKEGFLLYDEDQEEMILAGQTYVNIHSSDFPGGEIRGQIVFDEGES